MEITIARQTFYTSRVNAILSLENEKRTKIIAFVTIALLKQIKAWRK